MADKEVTIKIATETDVSQVESLESQLEEIQSTADNLGDSLDNALNADLDTSGISEASDELEEMAGSADDAGASIDSLSESMGVLEAGALLGVAEQLGGLGGSAEGMAQEMNTASISVGQLATNVGMAEPQMVSLINYISNATFPQEEAMAYVGALNQMGVSADQLGSSATNMDKINDATGIGYQSVMNLTAGLRSMGISADNLPSSFNAIAYAQSNVFDGANTLSQVLRTQAGTINEYGLNVDQLVVVLSSLQSQTGLTGRKLSSELANRLKECNGDVNALEQSLGLQNGTLSNASALTGQYDGKLQQLADEEAEHKTLLDQLSAGWEDLTLSMSGVMSPAMSVLGLIGQFGQFTVGINGILTLAETFGILNTANLATIPGLVSSTVAKYASATASWALAVAEWAVASPLVLLAVLIGAVVLALIALYMNSEQVRVTIDNLAQSIWNAMVSIGDAVGNAYNVTVGYLSSMINSYLSWRASVINTVISTASGIVNGFVNGIRGMYNALANELNNMISLVNRWASRLPSIFWNAGVNAVKQFLGALGIASPGTMQRMLLLEIQNMGERVPETARTLLGNIGSLGSDVVNEFGTPNLDMNYSLNNQLSNNNSNNTGAFRDINITVEGDVDSDDRIQQIVDAVTRSLAFDNKTAGRII